MIELQETYANPFDQDEISVEGIFITPCGKEVVVPAFFCQEFERKLENSVESLNPVGNPHFRIRFSPEYVGDYKFLIVVRDKTGKKLLQMKFLLGQKIQLIRVL